MRTLSVTLLFIFASCAVFGQTFPPMDNAGKSFNYLKIGKFLWIATNDTVGVSATAYPGAIVFRQQSGDTAHYRSNGVKWSKLASTDISGIIGLQDSLNAMNLLRVTAAGNTTPYDIKIDAGTGKGLLRFSADHATTNRWYSMTTNGGAYRPLLYQGGGFLVSDFNGGAFTWDGKSALQVNGVVRGDTLIGTEGLGVSETWRMIENSGSWKLKHNPSGNIPLSTFGSSGIGVDGGIILGNGNFSMNMGGIGAPRFMEFTNFINSFQRGKTSDLLLTFDPIANRMKFLPLDSLKLMLDDVAQLTASSGGPKTTAIVKDPLRGGTFLWSSSGSPDNGTVFTATGGGYWVRQFDEGIGLNVCWFGAIGDGVTDDTEAIEDAFAAVKAGGKVYFPNRNGYPGTLEAYTLSRNINITKEQLMIYSNADNNTYSTTIKGTGTNYTMFTLSAEQITFKGLTLRGDGAYTLISGGGGAGRWGQGATINGLSAPGDVDGNSEFQLLNCSFLYLDTAVIQRGRNMTVSDNVFAVCKNAIAVLSTTGEQRGVRIYDNWFHSIGDTTVGRFIIKVTDANSRQIWIHQNNYDGQSNALCMDISALDAVELTGNTGSFTRGGFIKLSGIKGAIVTDNLYIGGSYQTRGNGIELTNIYESNISNNNISQAAGHGMLVTGGGYNTITNNTIKDFSWTGKAIGGDYDGIQLGASSKGNRISSNMIRITGDQSYSRPITFLDTLENRINLNDFSLKESLLNDSLGNQFANGIKAKTYMWGTYDSIRAYDISYTIGNNTLDFSRTGVNTPIKLYPNGNVLFNNTHPNTLTPAANYHFNGTVRLDLGGGTDATGDMFYRFSNGNLARIPIGSNGYTLQVVGGTPTFDTPVIPNLDAVMTVSGSTSRFMKFTESAGFVNGNGGELFTESGIFNIQNYDRGGANVMGPVSINGSTITINGLKYASGSGSPEGTVTAPVGSWYSDTSGGTPYFKKTGSGNTGWKAITIAP